PAGMGTILGAPMPVVTPSERVATRDLAEPRQRRLRRALERLVVEADETERGPEAAGPLVVVQCTPVLVGAHVDAVGDRAVQTLQRALGVGDAAGVVGGRDAV